MMKYAYLLLFSIFYYLANSSTVLAQETIDPILLPDTKSGSYSYTFGIEYSPNGDQNIDVIAPNLELQTTRFSQNFIFSASGSYSFSKHFSVSGFVRPSFSFSEEKLEVNNESNITNETESDISTGFNLNYRIAPNSDFNPRLTVGYTNPSTLRFQTSANVISDPIVLSGTVGYANSLNNVTSELQTQFGVTFIANRDISLNANVNYNVPLQEGGLPTTSVVFRTRFWLDANQRESIAIKNTSAITGNQYIPGLGVEYSFRSERSLYEIEQPIQSNNEKSNQENKNNKEEYISLIQNEKNQLFNYKDFFTKHINSEQIRTSQDDSKRIDNKSKSQHSNQDNNMVPFDNLRLLSEAAKKGWWLSTNQLANLLAVSENTITNQGKIFEAYGFKFKQIKRWEQQKQWVIENYSN